MAAAKLHIFTAIRTEAAAIRGVLPPDAELTVIGIRAVRLPKLTEARAIILAGFAGALDPILRIGDIVHDDPPGTIHTSAGIVATAAAKAELHRQTGAKAVDMESSIVRAFAQRLNAPFFGIRAISDAADEEVDPSVLQFIDETGRLRPAALAFALLQKPSLLPTLNRLRRNSAIAGRALAEGVRTLLQENGQRFA